MFKNNANLSESSEKRHNDNFFLEAVSVDGMYDSVMHVGECSAQTRTLYLREGPAAS